MKVTPSNLTLGNGSNDVLELVIRAFVQPGEGVVSRPRFCRICLSASGAGANYRRHLHKTGVMIWMRCWIWSIQRLAQFSSPIQTIPRDMGVPIKLRQFLDALPSPVIAIVDEAYFEYVEKAATQIALKCCLLIPI
ncbi:MAG: hypothetical protein CM1200mP41_26600 [Gammaproteobacteria bacterium]|nr:MAG: hypothetical protein CM1200mP41_26600 [Gammaproteobacteria bacterium]